MKPIKVRICLGTTCHVMGASESQLLPELLPAEWRDRVEVTGASCLGHCQDRKYGKAPYAEIDGEVVAAATVQTLLAKLEARLRATS